MNVRVKRAAQQVRRRFNGRVFCAVFVAMMIAVTVYAWRQPRVYEARGELEIRRIVPLPDAPAMVVEESAISCGEDLNTTREVVASRVMLRRVTDRLSVNERDAFLEPYGRGGDSDEAIEQLIRTNRILAMAPKTWRLELRFRHPDRLIASRIVEVFLDESVAYEAGRRMDDTAYAVRMLTERSEQVAKQVETFHRELAAYRESRPELGATELEKDDAYQALSKKAEDDRKLHKMILERLSDANSGDQRGWGWRIIQAPTVPSADEYLRAPIFRNLGWGVLLAAATAALAAVVFKRQGAGINQQGDL